MNVWYGVLVSIFAFILGFVMMMFVKVPKLYSKKGTAVTEEVPADSPLETVQSEDLTSPVTGKVEALADVPDPVFSTGAMGPGAAVEPTVGEIVAPADATVSLVFPTKHALGLVTDSGAEILIHIGMDTVELEGQYFTVYVDKDQKVKRGDKLISFDIKAIKEAGYSVTTPVIVTNAAEYIDIQPRTSGTVTTDELLLTLTK